MCPKADKTLIKNNFHMNANNININNNNNHLISDENESYISDDYSSNETKYRVQIVWRNVIIMSALHLAAVAGYWQSITGKAY